MYGLDVDTDPTTGERDRFPMPGICVDGNHFETRVYRLGSVDAPVFLCRRHLVERIKKATWPHPPRNLGSY